MKTIEPDSLVLENAGIITRFPQHAELRRDRFEREKRRKGFKSLICEGDSWFENLTRFATIPNWLNSHNLDFDYKFAVFNIASAGKTASDLARAMGSVTQEVSRYHPQGLALSIGGNDLLNKTNLSKIIATRAVPVM